MVISPENTVAKTASGSGLELYMDDDAIGVNVIADDGDGGDVDYIPIGDYTVKVTFVTDVKLDADDKVAEIEYKTRADKFTVRDNIDLVTFEDVKEVETELDLPAIADLKKVTTGETFETVKEIIGENHECKFDKGNDGKNEVWNLDTETSFGTI